MKEFDLAMWIVLIWPCDTISPFTPVPEALSNSTPRRPILSYALEISFSSMSDRFEVEVSLTFMFANLSRLSRFMESSLVCFVLWNKVIKVSAEGNAARIIVGRPRPLLLNNPSGTKLSPFFVSFAFPKSPFESRGSAVEGPVMREKILNRPRKSWAFLQQWLSIWVTLWISWRNNWGSMGMQPQTMPIRSSTYLNRSKGKLAVNW